MIAPMQRPDAASLWTAAILPPAALDSLKLRGADPVLPSSFHVGEAAATATGLSALAAAELWHMRSGRRQQVSVDFRHAAAAFRSDRYLRVNGRPMPEAWDRIAGLYRCGDGNWVRLHTNFPHHRDGMLKLLGCEYDREAVAHALQYWRSFDLEDAAAAAGLCAAALRSFEQWDSHPQGVAVPTQPLVCIEPIGEAPAVPLPEGDRPLAQIRVLDLTRVIAGPVCGRALAAYGADVLLITSPHLPSIQPLLVDTSRGKLSAQLDLREEGAREILAGLVRNADIFVQSYRPGAIASLGFGPKQVAELRPGIVYVSLSAYGWAGPWSDRRGFDSLVQTATGFNVAEAQASGQNEPRPLPAQVLDHASGYLMAFGAVAGLYRRATEGGSWHVRVSLARTGFWLHELGRVPRGFDCPDPRREDVQDLLETSQSEFGELTTVRPPAQFSETPAYWERPSSAPGAHPPAWP
ncbi:MAG: CoA transferase [Acetobacteraceae bacterium]|nr:CoA transferase [Acetobacteraceae bacterium]